MQLQAKPTIETGREPDDRAKNMLILRKRQDPRRAHEGLRREFFA